MCDIIQLNGNGTCNIGDKLIMEKRAPLAVKKIQLQGQLRFQFNLNFTAPKPAQLTCLNNWLTESLGIDSTSLNSPHCLSLSQQELLAEQWLWRILLLVRQLMQDARVPIFDFPMILALTQNEQASNQWQAKVALARIDMIPPSAYIFALNQSTRLCGWAGENPLNDLNLKLFYDEIEKQIIGALSKILPPGQSTMHVLQSAYDKGFPFRHLGAGVFQIGWGKNAWRIDRSTTEKDSAIGAKLSQNKVVTANLLRVAGFPAPEQGVVRRTEDALRTALRIGWPVVVKPADLDRGEGVTVDVIDEHSLTQAYMKAAQLSISKEVIIERQVPGVCHRLFIANGKLLYAVKRLPISVIGNGMHTIEELVANECAKQARLPPWKRSEIKPLDDLAHDAIVAAGFVVSSIPAEGVLVSLRKIESTEWGGVDEEVTDRLHPENLRLAIEAARLFGLNVTGIDMISSDISKPWYENGAILNEINFAPVLGEADISSCYVPIYIDYFIQGNCTIPVDVFIGGDAAWFAASEKWKQHLSNRGGAYLTNAVRTLSPSGTAWTMPFSNAYERIRALILSAQVERIFLVVQTDEFLYSDLPLEKVDSVTLIDTDLVSHDPTDGLITETNLDDLLTLLAKWDCKPRGGVFSHAISVAMEV
jgi:cyanophycin synthetase